MKDSGRFLRCDLKLDAEVNSMDETTTCMSSVEGVSSGSVFSAV